MKTSVSRTLYLALSSASILALAATGSAHADRKRAPIVYAGSGQSAPSPVVAPNASSGPAKVTEQRRVEFRYPDQPDTYYGPSGPRAAPAYDDPIAFSSATAALTPEKAQTYTAPKDPAISAGGFDARAAAASVSVAQSSTPAQPIRIAAVQPQNVARTGKPLTLSRVRANQDATVREETGPASIYTDGFNGQPTANGEIFDETAMTAAHPSLPLPSLVQVVNQSNSREVVVRVNDRGPFDGKRILELSPRAGSVLGMNKGSNSNVKVRYLGPAPVQTNDQGYATAQIEDESLPPVVAPAPKLDAYAYNAPRASQQQPISLMNVSAPVAAGNVYIQAGSFADISNAQNLTSALGRGLSVQIEEARVNGGDYFRVMIGPFQSRGEAEVQRAQLSRAGVVDGFITTR